MSGQKITYVTCSLPLDGNQPSLVGGPREWSRQKKREVNCAVVGRAVNAWAEGKRVGEIYDDIRCAKTDPRSAGVDVGGG